MGKRLFVSIDLDGLADAIAAVQERLAGASGLNLVDPTQAHVTVKFLGDTDPNRLPELTDGLQLALDESGIEAFDAEFGGLGAFPSPDYISVVWLGVRDGSEKMTRLFESIERRTVELGFEKETHDFTPHVTLARMNHAGGKGLVQEALRTEDPTVGRLDVEELRLKESTLTEDGPEYRTLEAFEL